MLNVLFLKGKLAEKLELGSVEKLSMIIGAACHDFGHDGFTNEYHKKVATERAIRFND